MVSFRLLGRRNGVSAYNQMWEACRNDPCLVGIAKDWKNTGKSRFGTIRIEDMTIDFVRRTPSIYEMLLEKPARFFLDLDSFSGPQEDQERKIQELIDIFVRAFKEKLDHTVTQEEILVMSNSVQTKFSKHVLFINTCLQCSVLQRLLRKPEEGRCSTSDLSSCMCFLESEFLPFGRKCWQNILLLDLCVRRKVHSAHSSPRYSLE